MRADCGTRTKSTNQSTTLAFKLEHKKHRNYGKEDGIKPSEWWANVSLLFDKLVTEISTRRCGN